MSATPLGADFRDWSLSPAGRPVEDACGHRDIVDVGWVEPAGGRRFLAGWCGTCALRVIVEEVPGP